MEEKRIDKLYDLLDSLGTVADDETVAALKWAIFELEKIHLTN